MDRPPLPASSPSPRSSTSRRGLRRLFLLAVLFAFSGAALLAAWGCGRPAPDAGGEQTVVLRGETMGTVYTVKVVDEEGGADHDALAALVQGRLDAVNQAMSTWIDTSELSRLNRYREAEPFPLSAELHEVLRVSREVSEASGGAFDVTVAPLVEAWGFGRHGRPPEPPPEEELARLRAHVGWAGLVLEDEPPAVRKADPELTANLSAVAKGYGVDRVAEALLAEGHDRFLVEVGGEVRAAGLSAAGHPWRLGIERPLDGMPGPGGHSVERVVSLEGEALATSGDYRNFYERDGKRYSHTLDPRTGRPVEHSVASVSVIAPTCAEADAWATALLVLGPDGVALAESRGLAAYFLTRLPDGGFEAEATPGFQAVLDRGESPPPAP